jgi:glycosyltransferase involved in cell wall biosynthesis
VPAVSLRRAVIRPSPYDRLVAARRPDAVVVGHLTSLRLLPRTVLRSDVPLVLDMHNVDSRWFRELGDRRAERRAARWERRALRRGTVVACSEEERAALLELDAAADVIVVRQGFDPAEWPPPSADRPPGHVVAFFGSLWYPVNLEGLQWFLADGWPVVRRAHPDAELWLFGPGADSGLDDPARGVRSRGWVDHLGPALHDADVLIVPILAGPGSRVKFPEALASGVPVVATTVGAESFGADGRFRRADDPVAFGEACVGLLDDPDAARAMAASARDYAVGALTWEQAAGPLVDVLGRIGRRPSAP